MAGMDCTRGCHHHHSRVGRILRGKRAGLGRHKYLGRRLYSQLRVESTGSDGVHWKFLERLFVATQERVTAVTAHDLLHPINR